MPSASTHAAPLMILVVSSQVTVGRVGISAIATAYAQLGIEGFYLPTILLASRPGLGNSTRHAIPAERLEAILAALDADGRLDEVNGVVTGYFPEADQVAAVARCLRILRRRRPAAMILVDPVIGDSGSGLFISEAAAAAIRDELLPIASVATPNRFELGWLSGGSLETGDAIDAAARALGPEIVVVTSAGGPGPTIETRCVTQAAATSFSGRRYESVPKGTGDVFSGLYAAALCGGASPELALRSAGAALEKVAQASAGKPWLDLTPLSDAWGESDWVAGVDGCRGGWAVVFRDVAGRRAPRLRKVSTISDILNAPEAPRIVAVDMPIGLPERVGAGGRGPEASVRPHLGDRKSSVFSIPSRPAVYAPDYGAACRIALETSTPPRKVSKQGFMLFEKIREVDAVMTPDLCRRVYEVHPELAFWRLNGGAAMRTPKKIKGSVNPAGIAERRQLLESCGFAAEFFEQSRPQGMAADDLVDACGCALIAERLARGDARSFPENPQTDARGLTVAIWA